MFLSAIIFGLIGTFTIHGDLIVHWNEAGVPNNFSGKWILWAMMLQAFLSMFTHSSFSKKRPGQNPLTSVVIIGTIAIVSCYILFAVIAYIRNRKRK